MDNYLKWWQACFFIAVGIFIGVIVSGKFIYHANKEADTHLLKVRSLQDEIKSSIDFRNEMNDQQALLLAASICTTLANEEPIIAYIPKSEDVSVMIPEDMEVQGMPEAKSLSDKNRELGGYDYNNKGEK